MPVKIIKTNEVDLTSVAVPSSHPGVSHTYIINEVRNELLKVGLTVIREEYTKSINGYTALGVYHITGSDSDLGLMFTWLNSYEKITRFKCAGGAFNKANNTIMISDIFLGGPSRGDVEAKVTDYIKQVVVDIKIEYATLVKAKDKLKQIDISNKEMAEMMGSLYWMDEISSSQMIKVKEAYTKAKTNNAWDIFNIIADSLKTAHPRKWMEQHKALCDKMTVIIKANPIVEEDPNQMVMSLDDSTLDDDAVEVNSQPMPEKLDVQELLSTDADVDASLDVIPSDIKEVYSEVLQMEAEEKAEAQGSTESFPTPPNDLPVYEEVAIPLEEQVAGAEVAEVSAEEIAISKPVVVDEPKDEPKEEENLDWVKEGPTHDEIFSPEEESESEAMSDNPFEF
jgi:hypothetical protein